MPVKCKEVPEDIQIKGRLGGGLKDPEELMEETKAFEITCV